MGAADSLLSDVGRREEMQATLPDDGAEEHPKHDLRVSGRRNALGSLLG